MQLETLTLCINGAWAPAARSTLVAVVDGKGIPMVKPEPAHPRSMPRGSVTPTRSFTWNGSDLVNATNPENGTVRLCARIDSKMLLGKGAELRMTGTPRTPSVWPVCRGSRLRQCNENPLARTR